MLSQIVDDAKAFSGFDIIVDDGSHKADKMLASLRVRALSEAAPSVAGLLAAFPACMQGISLKVLMSCGVLVSSGCAMCSQSSHACMQRLQGSFKGDAAPPHSSGKVVC